MTRRKAPAVRRAPEAPEDDATAYAADVVSGKVVAGLLARLAAERHLRDLRDAKARGLFWAPDKARHALGFFPNVLTITAGALVGRPFHPLPWHAFAIGGLFGWRRADGTLRFRTAWFETGKGQAKSPLMAGIGLYRMIACGLARPEVYAIAGDKDQANVLFKDGVAMCRAPIPGTDPLDGDTLEARGAVVIRGTGDMAWKIEHPASGGKFQSLASGEAVSGPRPAVVLADEIHEMKSAAAVELWAQAIAKMPGDPLMVLGTNTPAAGQLVGTEYSEYYQRVVKGTFSDDSSFVYIARTDKGDKPLEDESVWPKSLPALGITFPVENVRSEVQKARGLGGKRLAVLRLYFGVPVGSSEFWIDEERWEDSCGDLPPDEVLRGWPCYLGMDLSQRNDLTALALVWVAPDGKRYARLVYWKPAGSLLKAVAEDKAPYDVWAADGYLRTTPGLTIGKDFVAAEVARACAEYNVQGMAFDQAHINDFLAECDRAKFAAWVYQGPKETPGSGLKLVRHAQGAAGLHSERMLWMPRSVQALEDHILADALRIESNPITTWCAANTAAEVDGQGNRYFNKKRSRGRIDGMVALAMAEGLSADEPAMPAASIWDRPDLLAVLQAR